MSKHVAYSLKLDLVGRAGDPRYSGLRGVDHSFKAGLRPSSGELVSKLKVKRGFRTNHKVVERNCEPG